MVDAVVGGLGLGIDQFPISLVRAQLSPRVRHIVDELLACAAKGRFD